MSLLIWYFVLAAKRIAAAFKPRVCGTAGTPDLPVAGPSSWFHYRNIDIQISANQQPTSNSIELFLSHFAGGAAKIFSTVESSNAQQVGANGLRLSQLRQDGSKKKNQERFKLRLEALTECRQLSRLLIVSSCHGMLEAENTHKNEENTHRASKCTVHGNEHIWKHSDKYMQQTKHMIRCTIKLACIGTGAHSIQIH